jgi:hypothetical protein
MADENVRALSRVDPKRQARNQKARRHLAGGAKSVEPDTCLIVLG